MHATNKPRSRAKPQVVIYLRTATSDQVQPGNPGQLSEQLNACLRKMTELGTSNAAVFVDYGKSGMGVNRSGLQDMLNYVAEHRTDHVIVKDLSRLSRNAAETVQIIQTIEEASVGLKVADGMDDSLVDQLRNQIAATMGRSLK